MPIPFIWRFSSQIPQPGIFVTNTYAAQAFPDVLPSHVAEIQKVRPVYRTEKAEFFNNNFDILVAGATNPNFDGTIEFQTGLHHEWAVPTDEERASGRNIIDDQGWVTFGPPVVGEFFKFLVGVHNVLYEWDNDASEISPVEPVDFIKEFIGIEIMYQPRGDF